MAFSPTPGSAGVAELLLPKFLTDYNLTSTVSTIIAFIWRLFTYYWYLIAGAIIIPMWVRGLLNSRKKNKSQKEEESH